MAEAGALIETVSLPLTSWSTIVFNSINAFKLVNADGDTQFVRWRFDPEHGERRLTDEELATADANYLFADVAGLLPITYRLLAQLATDDDQTTDPSKAWPEDREWVEMGTVEITGLDHSREGDGDVLVRDPMRLVDGIEPSDDPILHIRSYVYAESVRRRSGHQPPDHLH